MAAVGAAAAGYRRAMRRGMPHPICCVLEALSVQKAAFTWGRQFRLAGRYTAILLWSSPLLLPPILHPIAGA